MPKVRFYRGSTGVSLPAINDGAFIVVQRKGSDSQGFQYGDIFVDINNATRLKIVPNNEYSSFSLGTQGLDAIVPAQGCLCMITNEEGNQIGVVIGNGTNNLSSLINTALIPNITYTDHLPIDFWNDKTNAYIGTDHPMYGSINPKDTLGSILGISNPEETLVLTRIY